MEATYLSRVIWTGDAGTGTSSYSGYGRSHEIVVAGKPVLAGSADPAYHGDPGRHNPEDLFVASVAACHMLTYLALCARHGVVVVAYHDDARGSVTKQGPARFERLTLSPVVTIREAAHEALAIDLHERAHALCVIANSTRAPVGLLPTVRVRQAVDAR